MRLACLFALFFVWAAPASACSLIWPGYERMTRDSDVVALVKVEAVTPGERLSEHGESLYGTATATVLTGLKGVASGSQLSFEHRMTDADFVCDYDVMVDPGQQYWVWLERGQNGAHTNMAVLDISLSGRDRRAIRAGVRPR